MITCLGDVAGPYRFCVPLQISEAVDVTDQSTDLEVRARQDECQPMISHLQSCAPIEKANRRG